MEPNLLTEAITPGLLKVLSQPESAVRFEKTFLRQDSDVTGDRWAEVVGRGVGACLAFDFQSYFAH